LEANKTINEWIELISEYDVIDRLNEGEKFSSINIEMGFDANSDALRKAIKRLGYKKSKSQGLYYLEHQKHIISFMDSIDVESIIEGISEERYYKHFKDSFFDDTEVESCLINKEIYNEYTCVSKELRYDEPEDLIHMILLQWLDKNRPINKKREYVIKAMNESKDFTKEEIQFILEKERQGYDLESMFYRSDDYNLSELSEEEFKQLMD
jgi:hypothetical protein